MKIIYEKKYKDQKDLKRAYHDDSGLDVFSPESFTLKSNEVKTISADVKFEIKKPWWMYLIPGLGLEIQVRPKSGLSKSGIEASIGTVDQSYTGYIATTLFNRSKKSFKIEEGQKIAQIVLMPVFNTTKFVKGRVDNSLTRGTKGFGSSGLK